jgi:hypothetical protein
MQMWQSALCGMVLKLDHSFKVVKRVRDASGHKQFGAVLTVMNEFCQVSCQFQLAADLPLFGMHVCGIVKGGGAVIQTSTATRTAALQVLACFPAETKSLTELEPELSKIMANFEKMQEAYEGVSCTGLDQGIAAVIRCATCLHTVQQHACWQCQQDTFVPNLLQSEECGPWAAYVDDAAALQAQLKHIFPSLQHILADITHVMRRFSETLTAKHCAIGECSDCWWCAMQEEYFHGIVWQHNVTPAMVCTHVAPPVLAFCRLA